MKEICIATQNMKNEKWYADLNFMFTICQLDLLRNIGIHTQKVEYIFRFRSAKMPRFNTAKTDQSMKKEALSILLVYK